MAKDSGFWEMSSFETFIPLGMLAVAASDLLLLLERLDSKCLRNTLYLGCVDRLT